MFECSFFSNFDRYDSELHLVHYNKKYGSYEDAKHKPQGILILARIYKVGLFCRKILLISFFYRKAGFQIY